jgi:hypothetical protein
VKGFEMSGIGGVGGARNGNPRGNYGSTSNQPSGFPTQPSAGGNPRSPSTLNPKAKVFETKNTKLISEDYNNALKEFSSLAENVSFHKTRKNQELGKAQVLFDKK